MSYNYEMLGVKILEERDSKYNGHLRVARSLGFGTYIQAEGLTQSGGIVGTIWKPTLKRIVKKNKIKNALILGLGGGTVAKYIKLFWPGAKITGVDIDPFMVELGKKYLGLDQLNVKTKIDDALKFVEKTKEQYDLIVVDLYNGDKFPEKFDSERFFEAIRRRLLKPGICIFNRLYYGDKRPETVKFGRKLEKNFGQVEWFYPEANLMFICSLSGAPIK